LLRGKTNAPAANTTSMPSGSTPAATCFGPPMEWRSGACLQAGMMLCTPSSLPMAQAVPYTPGRTTGRAANGTYTRRGWTPRATRSGLSMECLFVPERLCRATRSPQSWPPRAPAERSSPGRTSGPAPGMTSTLRNSIRQAGRAGWQEESRSGAIRAQRAIASIPRLRRTAPAAPLSPGRTTGRTRSGTSTPRGWMRQASASGLRMGSRSAATRERPVTRSTLRLLRTAQAALL